MSRSGMEGTERARVRVTDQVVEARRRLAMQIRQAKGLHALVTAKTVVKINEQCQVALNWENLFTRWRRPRRSLATLALRASVLRQPQHPFAPGGHGLHSRRWAGLAVRLAGRARLGSGRVELTNETGVLVQGGSRPRACGVPIVRKPRARLWTGSGLDDTS
jgi:hypothetical protein